MVKKTFKNKSSIEKMLRKEEQLLRNITARVRELKDAKRNFNPKTDISITVTLPKR